MATSTKSYLADLVRSFDNEDGLPEEVYNATWGLLLTVCGDTIADEFSSIIDAVNGNFYAKNRRDLDVLSTKIFSSW